MPAFTSAPRSSKTANTSGAASLLRRLASPPYRSTSAVPHPPRQGKSPPRNGPVISRKAIPAVLLTVLSSCTWHSAHEQQTTDVVVTIRNNHTGPVRIFAAPEFLEARSGTTVGEVFLGLVPANSIESFPLKWRYETIHVRGEIVDTGRRIIWSLNLVEPGDTWTYRVTARRPPS